MHYALAAGLHHPNGLTVAADMTLAQNWDNLIHLLDMEETTCTDFNT